MIKNPAIYGMNRKRMRMVKHMSCGQKRLAMLDLLKDLAKLAILKRDVILDKNLTRWDDWIYKGRVDKIDWAYNDLLSFHGLAHRDHEIAHLQDTCGVV